MSSPYAGLLAPLIRQRGVVGCMVVGERDGIIVDANLQVGVQGSTIAALAASLYRKARVCSRSAGLGSITFLQLEAERGHICAAGRDELVIVVIADSRTHVGPVRTTMLQSLEALR